MYLKLVHITDGIALKILQVILVYFFVDSNGHISVLLKDMLIVTFGTWINGY